MLWPFSEQSISSDDDRIEAYRSDIVMMGQPERVYRLRDSQDMQELFSFADCNKVPVTFAGSQTSLTGSSVAESGLLFSSEKQNSILEIHKKQGESWVECEPGVNLFELKEALKSEGLFYPPDPTSQKDASVGGTISTNATGEDSYYFGSSRLFVKELELILASGEQRKVSRESFEHLSKAKNLGGYFLGADEIDYFIGSEGTLAYISKIKLSLLDSEPDYFASILFFSGMSSLFQFLRSLHSSSDLEARCIELIDQYSLNLWSKKDASFEIPAQAKAALYIKILTQGKREKKIQDLLALYQKQNKDGLDLSDASILIDDENKKADLRDLRHLIPATINEKAQPYLREGGGKLGTDWWVPIEHIEEAHQNAERESEALGLEFCSFGHIGNGHPHFDYVAKTAEEKKRAQEMIYGHCQRAVAWGGGVAGEHGIGKVKKKFLSVQYSEEEIQKMWQLKRQYDPHLILGRGNILS